MATDNESASAAAPTKALSAAKKRALRRAKVLQQSEQRLSFLKGSTSSLKEDEDHHEPSQTSQEQVDEQEEEQEQDGATASSQSEDDNAVAKEMKLHRRVDPVARRREAAARRKRNEAQVEQLLNATSTSVARSDKDTELEQALTTKKNSQPATVTATSFSFTSTDHVDEQVAALASASEDMTPAIRQASQMNHSRDNEAVCSSHLLALRISTMEKHIARLLVALMALALAFSVELGGISTGLESDHVFASYQQLFAQGVPLSSIRRQMESEKLDASVIHRIEHLFEHPSRGVSSSAGMDFSPWQLASSSASLWDLPSLLEHWMAHPPLVVFVLLLRVLLSLFAKFLRSTLQLPHVRLPSEGQFGFVADLFLANRPALKDQLVILRNSLDDLLLFVYLMVLTIASRAILAKFLFAQ